MRGGGGEKAVLNFSKNSSFKEKAPKDTPCAQCIKVVGIIVRSSDHPDTIAVKERNWWFIWRGNRDGRSNLPQCNTNIGDSDHDCNHWKRWRWFSRHHFYICSIHIRPVHKNLFLGISKCKVVRFFYYIGAKLSTAGVHFSFDVLPSWADQGSCAHKCVYVKTFRNVTRNAVNKSVWRKKRLFLTSL